MYLERLVMHFITRLLYVCSIYDFVAVNVKYETYLYSLALSILIEGGNAEHPRGTTFICGDRQAQI
jgi:hypothetical protein